MAFLNNPQNIRLPSVISGVVLFWSRHLAYQPTTSPHIP
jgi:hypothetical protein